MKVYALAEIKRALQKIDVLPLIKEGFIAYSSGLTVVPPVGELLFDNPPGDVHIKYGYIKNDDYYVVKIASGFYGNSQNNIPPSQGGVMILFDQKTGKEVGILVDECYLTNVRTAVAGAICAEFFSPKKVNCIGIIGSGIQARMQLEYLTEIIDCKKVKVWSRSEKGIDSYINDMSSFGWNLEKAKSPDEIAATCDLIITATPSKTPLLKSEYLKKGAHIKFPITHPSAYKFYSKMGFSSGQIGEMANYRDNLGMSHAEAATAFIEAHRAQIDEWMQ